MTVILTLIMWVLFFLGHLWIPEQIPFDYTVILGGIGGTLVAIANFFLMALTVQAAANATDEKLGQQAMRVSYSRRMGLMAVWAVIAIVVPVFQFAAGIAPIFFPSLGIKFLAFTGQINMDEAGVDTTAGVVGNADTGVDANVNATDAAKAESSAVDEDTFADLQDEALKAANREAGEKAEQE